MRISFGFSERCISTAVRPLLPAFFPALKSSPLTFARPYDTTAPASALAAASDAEAALPVPQLEVRDDRDNLWAPESDLLALQPLWAAKKFRFA